MSDETEAPASGKKKQPADRSQGVTPIVRDQDLFEFLEQMFYGDPEPEQYPEKIELNVVAGRASEQLRAIVWTRQFAPIRATEEAIKRGAGSSKPSREVLVAMSNLILQKMQQDCDGSGSPRSYGVHAWSTAKGDIPYMRFLKRVTPKGRYPREGGGGGGGAGGDEGEDGEPMNREQKFTLQLYGQQQKMAEMYGELVAGMIDRYSRDKDRDSNEIDKLHRQLAEKNDQLERALSLELEREERRETLKMKRQIAEKGWQAVETFAPMLISSFMGRKVIDTTAVDPNAEDISTLREFLKTTDEGGRLTMEQAHAAFGKWDTDTNTMMQPGILTSDQATILVLASQGRIPFPEIDKLLPGGPYEVTMDQVMKLAKLFGEQILPLQGIIAKRQQQAHQKKGDS